MRAGAEHDARRAVVSVPPEPPPAASGRGPASSPPLLDLLLEIDDDVAGSSPEAGEWLPDAEFLRDWAGHALAGNLEGGEGPAIGAAPGASRHELSIRLVGAEAMRVLNRDWRGRDAPTNVLSFPADLPALPLGPTGEAGTGGESGDAGSLLALGDLALCPPVIEAEATAQGKGLRAHWAHLVVHGVLHLRGLDHEDEASAVAMEGLEIRLLSMRDLPDPYGDRAASP